MKIIHRQSGLKTFRLSHRFWFLNRLIGKIDALRCRKSKQHTTTDGDWGYGLNGIVDLYCPNCLQIVCQKPLDDCSNMDTVLDTLEKMKTGS